MIYLVSAARGGFSRSDLLATLAFLFLLLSIGLAAQRRVQTRARMDLCQNNLKRIAHSVQMFANDNQGKLPGAPRAEGEDSWWWYKEQVKGYLGLTGPSSENDHVFACPLDRGYSDPGPFHTNARFDYNSYVFNGVFLPGCPNIAGWGVSEIAEPGRTLSVLEWCAHAPLSWHRSRTGQANAPFYSDAESMVSFVDGHASLEKIYYDGYNAAYTRDPIPGYKYRYSGK